MTARPKASFRRSAGLMLTFALALSLPGVSEAVNHNTCTEQGSSDPNSQPANACPEFSPGFVAHVKYPYRNTPAAINLEVSQAQGESNMLLWEWFLPSEWQFTTDLDPAQKPTGGAPANCNEIFNASDNAPNAEAVSDGNAIWTKVGTAAPVKWFTKRGMYFLNTVGDRSTFCVRFSNGSQKWTTPVYLDRIDSSGSPYGWKVTLDVETIQAETWWANAATSPAETDDFSLVTIDLEFKQKTSGTWHRVNGSPTSVVFSRAPRDPIQTKIGTRAFACTNGANTAALCDSTGGLMLQYPYPRDTNEDAGLAEFPFTVNLPPALPAQPWADISKGGSLTIPGTGAGARFDRPVNGFGYHDGSPDLPMTWPALTSGLASGVTVVGYAVAVHKIVPHQQPTAALEEAAGRIQFKREMNPIGTTLNKSFDVSTLPENAAAGEFDGKYDLSLVTIYNATIGGTEYKGYRSDGLCDGPLTGQQIYDPALDTLKDDDGRGVLCPPGRPVWLANRAGNLQGTSDWQVMVRKDSWPLRYTHNVSSQPFQVVLVDPILKRAELTVWGSPVYGTNGTLQLATPGDKGNGTFRWMWSGGRADQGPSYTFRDSSNLIIEPTGPATGVLQFGAIDLEGESENWWFTGRFGGAVAGPGASAAAYGIFEQYAARGSDLDWFRPGSPSASPAGIQSWATSVSQQQPDDERAYPETITSEFIGTAF